MSDDPPPQHIHASQLRDCGLFPGVARIQAISSNCEVVFLIQYLAPKRKREQNVFANFVGREQLSDAVGVYCYFILANFH